MGGDEGRIYKYSRTMRRLHGVDEQRGVAYGEMQTKPGSKWI
jgi:hypothetical protein